MTWLAVALAIPGALLLMLILMAALARKIPEYHGDDYRAIDEAASRKAAHRVQRPLHTAPPLAHAAETPEPPPPKGRLDKPTLQR